MMISWDLKKVNIGMLETVFELDKRKKKKIKADIVTNY